MATQKLQNTNIEIERLNREELQLNHDNIDSESQLIRIQNERRELLSNIERITLRFDQAVQDMGRAKTNMDFDNDWQTKLIVSKRVLQTLEACIKVRR